MTGTDPAASIPPGWFADPSGEQRMRWWDGVQWTEHVSAPAQSAFVAAPERNTVPATTPVGNVFIWIIVLLPIVSLLASFTIDYRALALEAVSSANRVNSFALYSDPHYLLVTAIGWVIVLVTALLAFFDSKKLRRDGVSHPFPWGWGFIPIVYIIGRAVVVHRRSGRGLAPLWGYVAVTVVSFVVSLVLVGQVVSVMMQYLPSVTGTT
jgi:hypothetical protein